jgi:hypothetical protein
VHLLQIVKRKLVGATQLERGNRKATPRNLGSLGPSLYHSSDDGEYARWLQEHPESACDAMVISYVDRRKQVKMEESPVLEPCEILYEENWLQRGLTPWVDTTRRLRLIG